MSYDPSRGHSNEFEESARYDESNDGKEGVRSTDICDVVENYDPDGVYIEGHYSSDNVLEDDGEESTLSRYIGNNSSDPSFSRKSNSDCRSSYSSRASDSVTRSDTMRNVSHRSDFTPSSRRRDTDDDEEDAANVEEYSSRVSSVRSHSSASETSSHRTPSSIRHSDSEYAPSRTASFVSQSTASSSGDHSDSRNSTSNHRSFRGSQRSITDTRHTTESCSSKMQSISETPHEPSLDHEVDRSLSTAASRSSRTQEKDDDEPNRDPSAHLPVHKEWMMPMEGLSVCSSSHRTGQTSGLISQREDYSESNASHITEISKSARINRSHRSGEQIERSISGRRSQSQGSATGRKSSSVSTRTPTQGSVSSRSGTNRNSISQRDEDPSAGTESSRSFVESTSQSPSGHSGLHSQNTEDFGVSNRTGANDSSVHSGSLVSAFSESKHFHGNTSVSTIHQSPASSSSRNSLSQRDGPSSRRLREPVETGSVSFRIGEDHCSTVPSVGETDDSSSVHSISSAFPARDPSKQWMDLPREPSSTAFGTVAPPREGRTNSIAVLGTMSDAGKSVITAAICRILVNGGTQVAPFKAQNMSNNASPALLPDPARRQTLYESFEKVTRHKLSTTTPVTKEGYGEIGTAQSLQAEACKIVPRVEMNPVLLKSGGINENGEWMCSVVVLGKQVVRETYEDLKKRTTSLRDMVLESYHSLGDATGADVIVIEGAGSCTELNLMDRDIVNLPLVRALQCPWLLVANIDCGGVFAQIVGTKMCVPARDWDLCVGVIVNKLRGEAKYFEPGPRMLETMVGKPIFVVPFLNDLNLPEEDSLGIERRLSWEKDGSLRDDSKENKPVVVVVAYPHTAIADDLCPLEQDERFHVEWRRKRMPKPYPSTAAVILPGSRLTMVDLKWLIDSGWADFIRRHRAAGGSIVGLCGGYQMLGRTVTDTNAVEGMAGTSQGIGLLPISTTISPAHCKVVKPRKGQLYPSGIAVEGFELHCGISEVITEQVELLGKSSGIAPLLAFKNGKPEGMRLGTVCGTYLHGIFRSEKARVELLVPNRTDFPALKQKAMEDPLDRFANHVASCGLSYERLRSMIFGRKEETISVEMGSL